MTDLAAPKVFVTTGFDVHEVAAFGHAAKHVLPNAARHSPEAVKRAQELVTAATLFFMTAKLATATVASAAAMQPAVVILADATPLQSPSVSVYMPRGVKGVQIVRNHARASILRMQRIEARNARRLDS